MYPDGVSFSFAPDSLQIVLQARSRGGCLFISVPLFGAIGFYSLWDRFPTSSPRTGHAMRGFTGGNRDVLYVRKYVITMLYRYIVLALAPPGIATGGSVTVFTLFPYV